MNLINQWWVWAAGGFLLAILEMVLPGYILLGFGIGAGVVAMVLLLADIAGTTPASMPVLILLFAVASLVAWYLLQRLFARDPKQVKTFEKDINDN